MELAPDGACDLREAALDRHVDVLVVLAERERPRAQLGLDGVEADEQGVAVGVVDDPARREHPGMRT